MQAYFVESSLLPAFVVAFHILHRALATGVKLAHAAHVTNLLAVVHIGDPHIRAQGIAAREGHLSTGAVYTHRHSGLEELRRRLALTGHVQQLEEQRRGKYLRVIVCHQVCHGGILAQRIPGSRAEQEAIGQHTIGGLIFGHQLAQLFDGVSIHAAPCTLAALSFHLLAEVSKAGSNGRGAPSGQQAARLGKCNLVCGLLLITGAGLYLAIIHANAQAVVFQQVRHIFGQHIHDVRFIVRRAAGVYLAEGIALRVALECTGHSIHRQSGGNEVKRVRGLAVKPAHGVIINRIIKLIHLYLAGLGVRAE